MEELVQIGRRFAGRFRIRSLLGEGGMGAVYLAEQEILGRQVALKLLRRELLAEPKMLRCFEREARAACRVNHPNLCARPGPGVGRWWSRSTRRPTPPPCWSSGCSRRSPTDRPHGLSIIG